MVERSGRWSASTGCSPFSKSLLDEPSEGLAPVVVHALAAQIVALKREGLTIILSEQNLKFATHLSDRAYIIEKGQIKYEGRIEDLKANPEVRRAYLMV